VHLPINHIFCTRHCAPQTPVLIELVCSKPFFCNQPTGKFSIILQVYLADVKAKPGTGENQSINQSISSLTTTAFCTPCRQFQFRVGAGNFCSVHVSLVPVLGVVGEQKTKPTQHSVAVLRSLGINPHLLACRSSEPLEQAVKVKLVSPCPSSAAFVACHCSEGSFFLSTVS